MINIELDSVLKSKLGFEQYFILYCLHTTKKQALIDYVTKCKKIDTSLFKELEQDGLLVIQPTKDNRISYELLSLTDKARSLVANCDIIPAGFIPESDSNFEEFRTFYPSFVKEGFKTRRLHGNLKMCRKTYDKLLMETTHDILCKCAKLYVEEKYRSNSQWFIQNLETWLNQKNYLQYLEDAKQLSVTTPNMIINDQSEDI